MFRDQTSLFWLGLFLLFILLCLSLATGAGVYGAREVLGYLMGDARWAGDEKLAMVLNTLRLPRTLCAMVVGASYLWLPPCCRARPAIRWQNLACSGSTPGRLCTSRGAHLVRGGVCLRLSALGRTRRAAW